MPEQSPAPEIIQVGDTILHGNGNLYTVISEPFDTWLGKTIEPTGMYWYVLCSSERASSFQVSNVWINAVYRDGEQVYPIVKPKQLPLFEMRG